METLYWLIGTLVYGVLALLALWGAFCVVLAWRRVAQTQFRNEEQQAMFLSTLDQSLRAGNLEEAARLCANDRRATPQLALVALNHRELDFPVMQRRVAERFQRDVLADLEHRLTWVGTVIKSAPMVGLLGTVMGMMGAFANLSSGENIDTTRMAQDIQFALITTACGLSIAIPLVMCTASINVRIRKMQDLVDTGLSQLFTMLKDVWEPPQRTHTN
ncbi:MAG: biopolymer transporter ExbB [Planctomycetes bacterium RBG_16_64_10]|nr:MAG: biopolymer transporter ExbB [Planctomycetes bacterium RBG_16_64_10]